MVKRTTTISIPEKLWQDFDLYCKNNGFKKSTLIQILITKKIGDSND